MRNVLEFPTTMRADDPPVDGSSTLSLVAIALVVLATGMIGAYGVRFARTTGDFLVVRAPSARPGTRPRSPVNTFPPHRFSGSPG